MLCDPQLSSRSQSMSTQMSIDSDVSPDEQEQPEQIWSKKVTEDIGILFFFCLPVDRNRNGNDVSVPIVYIY